MRHIFTLLPCLFLLPSSLASTVQNTITPQVKIKNGTLLGAYNPDYDQEFFLGIPYAQAPVGNLRYRHPQPLNESWTDRRATTYGPWCYSAPLSLPGFSQSGFQHVESEDCLSLNVIRPSNVSCSSKLPILVWIHGGGLQEGSSADQRYNMSFLVQESVSMGTPMIGVSFNYRLSGFGFLQGRAFNESGIANLGLYDQRLALRWIQENIEAFGGDPSRITISGESSGGISVGHHFLAFGGRDDGLFSAGIAESGGPLTSSALLSLDQQDSLYERVLSLVNCTNATDTIQCLRGVPAVMLKSAFQGISYYPVIDGSMIKGLPSDALRDGQFVRRPIIIGSNTNEGTAFSIPAGLGIDNTTGFHQLVSEFDSGHALSQDTINDMVAAYTDQLSDQEVQNGLDTVLQSPNSTFGSLYGRVTLYVGDLLFHAGRRYANEMWAKHNVPSYSYRFNAIPQGISPQILGATHFQEVAFVFRNLNGVGYATKPFASNSTDLVHLYDELSTLMSRMWISFTVTESPNFYKVPKLELYWPAYAKGAKNMVFQTNGSQLEDDVWRKSAIQRIISDFDQYKL